MRSNVSVMPGESEVLLHVVVTADARGNASARNVGLVPLESPPVTCAVEQLDIATVTVAVIGPTVLPQASVDGP
jgi:hypothetical protein